MRMGNLGTILFSESADLLGGTVSRMSPELMAASKARATRESDCYALGMMTYEVS